MRGKACRGQANDSDGHVTLLSLRTSTGGTGEFRLTVAECDRSRAQPSKHFPRPALARPSARVPRVRSARRPRPRVHRVAGAAAALSLLAGLTSASAVEPQDRAGAVRGSDGIGDPYFPLDGNGGIDVLRYRIHDTYRFGDRHLRGKTRITLRATQDLKTFNLDFLLPVHRVTVDGRDAGYAQASPRHELVIRPQQPLQAGERVDVVVAYAGFPERHGYRGERNWLASDHEVVTMNQPHMAPWWFPANDHPLDKAMVDIHITVPRGKQVVANGRLVSHEVRGDTTTYHWRADEPMVPYLAFFAAGRFEISQGTHRRTAVAGRGVAAACPVGATGVRGADRADAGHRGLARDPAGRLPLQPDRRAGDQPAARLRPGEPDPADVPPDLSQHGRPRARPPVVRRLRGRARVARHLAQRGLRHLHGAGVRRGARRPGRPAVAGVDVGGVRGRRPVLDARDRRPRARPASSPGRSTCAAR